jgi:hypothetical protein
VRSKRHNQYGMPCGCRMIVMFDVQEVQQYWQGYLALVEKPSALDLIQYLDLTQPLGFLKTQQQNKSTPLAQFYLEIKRKHADKVLLVRVRVGGPSLDLFSMSPLHSCCNFLPWSPLPHCITLTCQD